ncbi:hypothetical protein ACH5RR_006615 [Cinchona calisaya]|uniref:G-patch domain-containing protein n=1 Tax=Cinchona calisaya TaxID=153742 RepID=A0ABD3APJ0_9GENT
MLLKNGFDFGKNSSNANAPVVKGNDYDLGNLMLAEEAPHRVVVKKARKTRRTASSSKPNQAPTVGVSNGSRSSVSIRPIAIGIPPCPQIENDQLIPSERKALRPPI